MTSGKLKMIRTFSRRALLVSATGIVLQSTSENREKLPIYPAPTPEILLLDTPSPLEKYIGIARRRVTQTYHDGYSRVQDLVSRWIGIEHAVEYRVKSIISPTEPLTPGVLYAGIFTLTGSILARNRSLPTRFLLPPAFLLVSFGHFLPQTSSNLSAYLSSLEETYFPTVAEKHAIATAHTRMTWERIKETAQTRKENLTSGVETAVERLQEATGLKLKETLRLNGTAIKKAEPVAKEGIQTVDNKIEEAKVTVDTKGEEAVEKIETVKSS